MDHEHHMREAIEMAMTAAAAGELPFGAVVVDPDGVVVARAHDTTVRDQDATRHCELLAVSEAGAILGMNLEGCTLYCTGEPCGLCFGAAWWARISRIVFGNSMAELRRLRCDSMEEVMGPTDRMNDMVTRKIETVSGVLHEECLALWKE